MLSPSPPQASGRTRPPADIGLVGCGAWGRHILRDLRLLGCRVFVVVPREGSRRNAVSGGAHEIVARVEELPRLDGYVVASPTTTHAAVVDALLSRDAPLFCEKPLTNDPRSAWRLAEHGAGRLFVMDKWRYHPGVQRLAEIARSGELGAVQGLKTRRLGWGNPHADVDATWILAPHELSIGLHLFGELGAPRWARADCVRGEVTGLWGSLGDGPWHLFEVGVRSPVKVRAIELICEGGTASIPDPLADHVAVVPNTPSIGVPTPAEIIRHTVSTEMPLLRELRAFVEHLSGGPPPLSSAREGAEVVTRISSLRHLAGLDGAEVPHAL